MPHTPAACRRPFAVLAVLAAASLALAGCSSGGQTPSEGLGTTTSPHSGGSTGKSGKQQLVKQTGKHAIKNVITKLASGNKVSLSAPAPGHAIMAQVYDASTKTWSKPTTVYKDDTHFCHKVSARAEGGVIAATVQCGLSTQDRLGTALSYVLVSSGGQTWKRAAMKGAKGKPIVSPGGKYVAWSSPASYLLWSPGGEFKTVPFTQSDEAPAAAVLQDTGTLLIVTTTSKKKNCTITIHSATPTALTPKVVDSTLPQSGYPACEPTSALFQGTLMIVNFTTTQTTKDNGKKSTKTTPFAFSFHKIADGKWVIKD